MSPVECVKSLQIGVYLHNADSVDRKIDGVQMGRISTFKEKSDGINVVTYSGKVNICSVGSRQAMMKDFRNHRVVLGSCSHFLG